MNYYRFAYYFGNCKSVGNKNHKRPAVNAEQRRHIARMVRVRAAVRVIMRAGARKRVFGISCAAAARVYMERKNGAFAFITALRQSHYLGTHLNRITEGIKRRPAANIGIAVAAVYFCSRFRAAA